MNIEEAIKKLELMEYKYTLTNNDDKAIETVLNELDKKNKVIDFMANSLTTDYHDTEWVKEYYYKLVEGNIDKK